MATATAEPQMVSVPSTDVVFLSRRSELVLIMKRDRPIFDGPERIGMEPGKRLAFMGGQLRVPRGPKAYVTGTRGERIPSEDVLRFLEGDEDTPPHTMLDNQEEGFWRLVEPPPPPSEAESTRIIELAEEQDVDGIEAFIAQERAGWDRKSLIEVAQGSLDRVKARLAKSAPPKAPAPEKPKE